DETSGILKSFITGIENLVDQQVKVIRCDNGTEFKNREMNQFCEMKGSGPDWLFDIDALRRTMNYEPIVAGTQSNGFVESAFLYEEIKKEVCVCQPPGFEDPNFPDRVYKVEKALYRLHQAHRAWYLKGQPKLGIWYPKDSPFDLVAYTDSDYVGASLDRKSTTEGCQFFGCRLISWQCKKQTMVVISTTEVEYVAASS
nr:putative ribonuclease H-like domain-containing protein [Tanacetum cinerariifolium]